MDNYSDLMDHQRQTEALGQVAGRLGWDQETMMPGGAAEQRAEEMAALESVLHARRVDPKIGDWLDSIEPDTLDDVGRANLRHIKRSFERNTKVPAKLAAELARVTSMSQGIWAKARADEDYDAFAPTLAQVIALRREEAAALADGADPYDALLNDYEPGMTGAELEAMFGALRPRLVALRDKILGSDTKPQALDREFDDAAQITLGNQIAQTFGYDFRHGRIDKAVHPFSSGSGLDVRITTRVSPRDPFNCLYSTIHEVGHANYEQGINRAYLLTPLGQGVSMGVHESQSRILENQIGRGAAFTRHLYGEVNRVFGDIGLDDPDAFYATVNRVEPGYIRTEADEVQYNLHILMRFDLERQIISGALEVADLQDAWDSRFLADFGVAVDKPSNGCLQDVHWSVGLFGYFPTYSLGNVYAGCLNKAMHQAVPDLDAALAKGDTSQAITWLRGAVHQHGGLYEPKDLIERACGFAPSEAPLLDYLEEKFSAIYRL